MLNTNHHRTCIIDVNDYIQNYVALLVAHKTNLAVYRSLHTSPSSMSISWLSSEYSCMVLEDTYLISYDVFIIYIYIYIYGYILSNTSSPIALFTTTLRLTKLQVSIIGRNMHAPMYSLKDMIYLKYIMYFLCSKSGLESITKRYF